MSSFPIRLYLVAFFIAYYWHLSAQQIINCKNDLAIVRLYLNNPKKIYLQKAIDQATNERDAIYFKDELAKHNKDRTLYTLSVIKNFKEFYPYSENLRFIPDSIWTDFREGKIRNYFVNDDGSFHDQKVDPKKLSYYVIGRGSFDEDFFAMDKMGNSPVPPFPIRLKHNLLTKLGTIFGDGMKSSIQRYCLQIKRYCDKG